MGISEIVLILVLFLLLFGPKKIPEVARTLGKIMKEVRGALDQVKKEIDPKD